MSALSRRTKRELGAAQFTAVRAHADDASVNALATLSIAIGIVLLIGNSTLTRWLTRVQRDARDQRPHLKEGLKGSGNRVAKPGFLHSEQYRHGLARVWFAAVAGLLIFLGIHALA